MNNINYKFKKKSSNDWSDVPLKSRLIKSAAVDLRDNSKFIDHGNGFSTILPIDDTKLHRDNEDFILINSKKFYYDPNEIKVDDDLLKTLSELEGEDEVYSIYIDESQGLVIY